jgi:hypothetical protein
MQYAKINRLRAWHNRMAKAYPSETPPKSTDPTEKWIEVVNFYGSDVPRGMKDQSLGFKGDPTVADGVTNGPNDPLYPKRNTSGGLDTFFIGAGTTIGTLDGGIGRFWKTNHFYLPGSTTPQTRTIELTLYPFSDSFWTVVATLCPPKANTC